MTDIRNKTVLITGGGQGIGRLLADRCATRGATRVILWDINVNTLEDATGALRKAGHNAEGHAVNLADPAQIAAAASVVLAAGPVDILINNAGIVVGKALVEHTPYDIENTIRVNVLGVIHTTRAFLPAMIERGSGHIVNVASASGFVPVPRLTTYGASKWACLGFSESLRVELQAHPGLHVSTICPSYIKTGMFQGASAPTFAPLLEPEYVADRIIRAIGRNQRLLRMPWIVNLVPMLYHTLPAPIFDLVCGCILGIYRSMEHFEGHQKNY